MTSRTKTLRNSSENRLSESLPSTRARRDQLFVKNTHTSLLGTAVNLLIAATLLIGQIPMPVLIGWFAIMTALTTGRWWYSKLVLESGIDVSRRQIHTFIAFMSAAGMGWGCLSFLLKPDADPIALHLIVFMIAGQTAGASLSYATHMRAVIAYNAPAILLLGAYYASLGGIKYYAMCGVLILYFALTRELASRANTAVREALSNQERAENQKREIESQQKKLEELAEKHRVAALEANAANVARLKFLSTMSHEIRTPMNGVLGMLSALKNTSLTGEQERFTKIGEAAATGLLHLINDILDLSNVDSGKFQLQNAPFGLRVSFEIVLESLRPEATKKNINFVCTVDSDIPDYLVGDETRLRQILFNLVGNAVKFTDTGEVALTAKRVGETQESCSILFSIKDTGIGIEPSQIPRLFKRFERADSDRVRLASGTGLGLAISHELVLMMGGQIECKSQPGKGSEFHFTLPFEIADDVVETNTDKVNHQDLNVPLNVLVAEDNLVNQEVAKVLLEAAGMDVTIVPNGREAVDKAISGLFDVVFMDVNMPVLDGLEATRLIREHGYTSDKLPIIALTAQTDNKSVQEFHRIGMDCVIAKPIQPPKLLEELNKIRAAKRNGNVAA